jgi:hypothetical protein
VSHIAWADLPAAVRAAVTTRIGPVAAARDVPHGYNCRHASILHTGSGPVFVKAATGPECTAAHDREQTTAPYVAPVAPALLWRTHADGWDIVAFEAVPDARHADLTPGSPDLPLLAAALRASTAIPAPAGLPQYTSRFPDADPADATLLHGDTLVHGDINPHNVVISGRAWLVDWATPTRGPAWADVAEAAIRLMEDGHSAEQAHAWAAAVPAWRTAGPSAIKAWAEARCRAWTARIGERGAASSNARHQALGEVSGIPLGEIGL